ncbi:hypothetical protein [Pseudonocardia sp. GCM10023141]|uniref:hypothetical protein n=1 Tax=Pseudonocardia sp. GCM10023141 TaxID=3252653 RepID=UPI00361C0F9F
METTSTSTTGWWNCAECDVDLELVESDVTGFAVDCPDCGQTMAQWRDGIPDHLRMTG